MTLEAILAAGAHTALPLATLAMATLLPLLFRRRRRPEAVVADGRGNTRGDRLGTLATQGALKSHWRRDYSYHES